MERPRRAAALASAALVAAVLAVYGQSAGFGFVALDDDFYVRGNRAVQAGLTPASLRWAFTTSYQGSWQPLTWLSYMAERELHGLDPAGHHLSNVLLHAANALLAFAAFHALTGALWRSAAVAALLALHPQHVESVAWIAERKGLLAAGFGLLSLWAYAGYARRGGAARYALCAGALALALLSKQVVVALPLLFGLLDVWPLRRLERGPARLGLEKLPLLLLCGAASAMALHVQGEAGGRAFGELLAPWQRGANALVSYALHLWHTLWPVGLSPYYPHPYVPRSGGVPWSGGQIAAAAGALAAVSALAVREAWRGRPWPLLGWLWFLGLSVPTIGLVPFGTHGMADRFAYLPMLGIYAGAVWSGADAARAWRVDRRVAGAAALAALALLGALAWRQARLWRDSETLFEHVLAVEPRAALIHYNYANVLRLAGERERAVDHFRSALEVHPGYLVARAHLANTLRDLGRVEEALDEYQSLALHSPRSTQPYYEAGRLLAQLGRRDEARRALERAARLDPDSEAIRRALADLDEAESP